MKSLEPGKWTTVEYPLSVYTDPKKVQLVHFVVRTNGKGYKGEIGLDEFVVTGAGPRIVLGEWNGAETEGWKVSPDANTKSVTKSILPSKAPKVPAAGDPVRCLAVSGADPKLVFLCQQKFGLFRSLDAGATWAHGHDFNVKVIVSEDGGKTFEEAKGLPDYRTHANTMWGEGHGRAISADPTNPDVIYLGIDGDPEKGNAGGGIFKSTDGGHNWKQLANQPGSRRMMYGVKVDPTDPKRIVWGACGSTAGVYVSEDAGESWKKTPNLGDWIFNVEVSAKGTVYAGGNQLYRSEDHGKTFRTVTNFKGVTVIGIACDPENENRMWISASTWDGNRAGGIYETADGGKTWTDITGDNPYPKPLIVRYNATTRELWAAGPAAFKLKR